MINVFTLTNINTTIVEGKLSKFCMSEACIKLVALRINRCTRSSSQFQKGWWPLVWFNWWNKNAHPPRALISKHRSLFVQSPPRKAESRHEVFAQTWFFNWYISIICPIKVSKLAVTVFASLYFYERIGLIFFGHIDEDRKKLRLKPT